MIYIISGLVAVIALSILATVQSRLELAEDFRAGALSIARAVILVSLAALWLIYQPGSMSAGVWLAVAIIAIWFSVEQRCRKRVCVCLFIHFKRLQIICVFLHFTSCVCTRNSN